MPREGRLADALKEYGRIPGGHGCHEPGVASPGMTEVAGDGGEYLYPIGMARRPARRMVPDPLSCVGVPREGHRVVPVRIKRASAISGDVDANDLVDQWKFR